MGKTLLWPIGREDDFPESVCVMRQGGEHAFYVEEGSGWGIRLFDENAKLRELVRDMLQNVTADGYDCHGCNHDKHEDCTKPLDWCMLVTRAKELGVEVE